MPLPAAGETVVLPAQGSLNALILYILLALAFSFLCSISEAVLLSITPSYVEREMVRNPGRGQLLRVLKVENVDRSLAAILTLNTIAHTVGAIGSGAEATLLFGSAWFGVFSAAMTLAILFLSEIVPKTIGAVYWQALVTPSLRFIRMLIVVLYPIVWISEKLTRFISRTGGAPAFTRDEFMAMMRIGQESGQIHATESRIIRNLFRFGSLKVTDIMTPRTQVLALPEQSTMAEAMDIVKRHPVSRLPVYGDDIDHITGFVLRDDVLLQQALGQPEARLETLRRSIVMVPESLTLSLLFDRLLKQRQHIAIVVDEFGGTSGLVTLEDILETIMGIEIMDETDNIEDLRLRARKLWMVRARALGIETDEDTGS
ncbi:MAG: HlyC/CorC family transporter [Bacteroidetes bacterium]|nr:HlyC/CorC family transporter [Bacteroidota bacterium]